MRNEILRIRTFCNAIVGLACLVAISGCQQEEKPFGSSVVDEAEDNTALSENDADNRSPSPVSTVAWQQPPKAANDAGMAKWATDTFKSLKDKGLTTAGDAGSWLSEDFENINAWEYKVAQIDVSDSARAEAELNKLGTQKWECFHVQPTSEGMVMFFKKPKRSFLKSLPTTDLMRLVPMMRGE